jgi:glycosyltransferase involved in cell wall biosynthesis
MHYAVPRLLHGADSLEIFYTDISAQKGWPRALALIPTPLQPAALRRLSGRIAHGVPARKIGAFTKFGLSYSRRRTAARNTSEVDEADWWAGRRFCELCIRSGLGNATSVYVFNTAGLELLQHARARGIRTVVEQTIAPRSCEMELLQREREQHPEWECGSTTNKAAQALAEREHAEWDAADVILCGSEFVREQIAAAGGPANRCSVVPYGVDCTPSRITREPHAGPLRVLTVGAAGLRKGSPDVFAAAQKLGSETQFRMIGTLPARLPGAPKNLDLQGPVPRTEITQHYAWADVFLLPSICEGSATVTYEALAAGLPVIATRNTGSVVRDGIEGFIVPCGDPDAIAEKLAALAGDRDLLQRLSQSAAERARDFTLKRYGERLLQALCH